MKIIYENKIFKILELQINKKHVVKLDSPDWANVVALNSKNEILLVKQFRYGIAQETWETPGGLIDERDSSPLSAAQRELREETGYTSQNWEEHAWVWANPAYQNNICHYFIAYDINKTHALDLDDDESISENRFFSHEEIINMIEKQEISHSIVLGNLLRYFQHKQIKTW